MNVIVNSCSGMSQEVDVYSVGANCCCSFYGVNGVDNFFQGRWSRIDGIVDGISFVVSDYVLQVVEGGGSDGATGVLE